MNAGSQSEKRTTSQRARAGRRVPTTPRQVPKSQLHPARHTLCSTRRRDLNSVRPLSMERLQLVRLHGRLVLVQVGQWVLGPVVVGIVVCVDSLRLEPSNRVEFLNG